jgi:hypothetical protein
LPMLQTAHRVGSLPRARPMHLIGIAPCVGNPGRPCLARF